MPILNLTLIPTCIHPLYQKALKKHFSKSRIRPFFASSHAKYEQKCHFFMYTRLWSSASGSEGEILESLKSKNGHLSDICLFQDSILDWKQPYFSNSRNFAVLLHRFSVCFDCWEVALAKFVKTSVGTFAYIGTCMYFFAHWGLISPNFCGK